MANYHQQIWSTELPAKVQSEGKGHAIFDPSKSKTFQNSPTSSWFIMYGDGSSASGTVGTDDVTIGGITIKDQSIELADQLFTSFVQGAGDGLLGLAFSSINTVRPFHVDTAVANMISQHLVPTTAELFTVKLTGYRDTTTAGSATTATAAAEQAQSFYTFGFIDEPTVKATGQEIQYAPINNMMGLWMFSSSSASVNGETIDRFWNHAIADTGTTLALVDDHTCKKIYDAIPGGKYDSDVQGYVFPDDTPTDKLPVVEFAVGDHMFAVHKEDLKFAEAKPGLVYGGVQSRGSMGFDILGDTFLKGVYAVFDVGNLRFGAVQR